MWPDSGKCRGVEEGKWVTWGRGWGNNMRGTKREPRNKVRIRGGGIGREEGKKDEVGYLWHTMKCGAPRVSLTPFQKKSSLKSKTS
jgi:hypothetical protein